MRYFLVFAATTMLGFYALPSFAQETEAAATAEEKPVTAADVFGKAEPVVSEKPLVVVRFNQPRVNFDAALSKAIGVAQKIKPDMQYEVVSFVPDRGNPAAARQNLQMVIGTMQRYGADISRITWRSELSNSPHQEVHIYIQ